MATRRDIVNRFADESRLGKDEAARLMDLLLAIIQDGTWQEGEVRLLGFGIFRVRQRKALERPHPSGDPELHVSIPAREVVTFKASRNWRTR